MNTVDDQELEAAIAYSLRELDRVWPKGRPVSDKPARLFARAVVAYLRLCGMKVVRGEPAAPANMGRFMPPRAP